MANPRAGTEVAAANGALKHCLQPPIARFDEANSRAKACFNFFADARDALLREHDWNFARKWVRPAALTTTSLGPLSLRYAMPGDCLAVRTVRDLDPDAWSIEASDGEAVPVLVTGAAAPVVAYTARIETVALWDALFLDVFELRLGAAIAPLLAKNAGLADDLAAKAEARLAVSKLADGREKAPSRIGRETSWIAARRVW